MEAMTIREAFEKAGYPVPEGSSIEFQEGIGWRTYEKAFCDSYCDADLGVGWYELSPPLWMYEDFIDISDLSYEKALNALPHLVKMKLSLCEDE